MACWEKDYLTFLNTNFFQSFLVCIDISYIKGDKKIVLPFLQHYYCIFHTEVEYRLTWTRTYMKKVGILENSSRGVWALTAKGHQTCSDDLF